MAIKASIRVDSDRTVLTAGGEIIVVAEVDTGGAAAGGDMLVLYTPRNVTSM
jgi:hypothetical protein